ncbi:MAG: hypothetical protein ACK5AZ_14950 [Bryobacteraceae bacterium]
MTTETHELTLPFREAGQPAVNDGPAPPVDMAEIARTSIAGEKYGFHVATWHESRPCVPNGQVLPSLGT